MLRGVLTSLTVVSALSALLILPPPSHAIPVAGNYEFTSGLTGTFTSNGTQLTSWSFTDPLDSLWHITWNPTVRTISNNPSLFEQGDFFGGRFGVLIFNVKIDWNSNHFDARRLDTTITPPIDGSLNGIYSFTPAGSPVPEPSTFGLLVAGLVALLAYKRHHAGLQIG